MKDSGGVWVVVVAGGVVGGGLGVGSRDVGSLSWRVGSGGEGLFFGAAVDTPLLVVRGFSFLRGWEVCV